MHVVDFVDLLLVLRIPLDAAGDEAAYDAGTESTDETDADQAAHILGLLCLCSLGRSTSPSHIRHPAGNPAEGGAPDTASPAPLASPAALA